MLVDAKKINNKECVDLILLVLFTLYLEETIIIICKIMHMYNTRVT